jgi:hypothetical protein
MLDERRIEFPLTKKYINIGSPRQASHGGNVERMPLHVEAPQIVATGSKVIRFYLA